MIINCPNKQDSGPVLLSVYGILVSHDINVVYTLYYFDVIFIYLKVRHCNSNYINFFINLGVILMLPLAVRSNAPVRLKVQLSKARM